MVERPRRRRRRSPLGLPRSPFVQTDPDRRVTRRERLGIFAELLGAILVPLLVLALLLAVALVVQALWSPVAGGLAALVILLVIVVFYWGLPPLG